MAVQAERQAQETQRWRQAAPDQARFVDVSLPLDIDSRQVAEISLPREAVLVSIRRGTQLIIPHGDTTLRAGDTVTALVAPAWEAALRSVLTRSPEPPPSE